MAAALKVASKNKEGGKLPWRTSLSSFYGDLFHIIIFFTYENSG
jgi:hypothetical protein